MDNLLFVIPLCLLCFRYKSLQRFYSNGDIPQVVECGQNGPLSNQRRPQESVLAGKLLVHSTCNPAVRPHVTID